MKKPAFRGLLAIYFDQADCSCKSDPQYLHFLAAALMVSAQKGQSFISDTVSVVRCVDIGKPLALANSMGVGLLKAQIKAATQPMKVQPVRRFSANIGVALGCSPTAQIAG